MNPVLNVPITEVMRSEIALPLQHIMHIYTVGHFVRAWRSPRNQKSIEQIFDTPEQARHAAAVCSTWAGANTHATMMPPTGWWINDSAPVARA